MIYTINKKALLQEMDTDALDDYMKDSAETKETASNTMDNIKKYGGVGLGLATAGALGSVAMSGARDAKNAAGKLNTVSSSYSKPTPKQNPTGSRKTYTQVGQSRKPSMTIKV